MKRKPITTEGYFRILMRGTRKWTSLRDAYPWGGFHTDTREEAYAKAEARLLIERTNRPGREFKLNAPAVVVKS